MPWDPTRYHQFQRERSAPFADLMQLVTRRRDLRCIDLGCGTGELTRQLADALEASDVTGLDSSPQMLERAQAYARSGLAFVHGTIESLSGEWDLIFSNAAIQWVPDHASLIPRLLNQLRPGGQLAIQLPSNHKHPSHTAILDVAAQEPFCTALNGWRRTIPVLSIDEYATLCFAQGATEITVFEKIYPHILADADAIADWTSGTALVPYLERMPEELHPPFMAAYRARLRTFWPTSPVFYPFRRTLFAATMPQ